MSGLYWNSEGKYQNEHDALHSRLVPGEGKAQTSHGELLRCATNIYYDWYNNGGCNFDVRGPHFGFLAWAADDDEEREALIKRIRQKKATDADYDALMDWAITEAMKAEGMPVP